jgi:CRISPR-associated protein (Cas_Cas02710)/Domain of unknown function (DUF1887)
MILLSLVGEQPIPNLLPLWQDPVYDQVQLAYTETTAPFAEIIQAAVAGDPQLQHIKLLKSQVIKAYDSQKSRLLLNRMILTHLENGQSVCLNFTGGTKIMSMAAIQAAYATGISLLYVSTEERQIIYYGSDGAEVRRVPIQVAINVNQYLQAHGLETSDNYGFKKNWRQEAEPPPKTGDEFEKKMEALALRSGIFDDVRRNVFIRKHNRSGAVINELDVVAVRNARLVVCSCKAGNNTTKDDLYELASLSLRESAGIYCGKVLATAAEVSPALVERARSMGIQLVSGSQVDHIGLYLKLATD